MRAWQRWWRQPRSPSRPSAAGSRAWRRQQQHQSLSLSAAAAACSCSHVCLLLSNTMTAAVVKCIVVDSLMQVQLCITTLLLSALCAENLLCNTAGNAESVAQMCSVSSRRTHVIIEHLLACAEECSSIVRALVYCLQAAARCRHLHSASHGRQW